MAQNALLNVTIAQRPSFFLLLILHQQTEKKYYENNIRSRNKRGNYQQD